MENSEELPPKNTEIHQNLEVVNSKAFETEISIEEKDVQQEGHKDTIVNNILDDVIDKDSSFIENLILAPLYSLCLVTICYLENPLMETFFKYPLVALSFTFLIYSLELLDFSIFILLIIGIILAIVMLLLDLMKIAKNAVEITQELISVFAAIGWISIFSSIIIDFITFLAFYFSID